MYSRASDLGSLRLFSVLHFLIPSTSCCRSPPWIPRLPHGGVNGADWSPFLFRLAFLIEKRREKNHIENIPTPPSSSPMFHFPLPLEMLLRSCKLCALILSTNTSPKTASNLYLIIRRPWLSPFSAEIISLKPSPPLSYGGCFSSRYSY